MFANPPCIFAMGEMRRIREKQDSSVRKAVRRLLRRFLHISDEYEHRDGNRKAFSKSYNRFSKSDDEGMKNHALENPFFT
jgi:hypothetical protein